MALIQEITARALMTAGPLVLVAGAWDERFVILPGGHVEAGESPLQAVRREIREEVSSQVADRATFVPLTVLQTVWLRGRDTVHETLHLYAACDYGVLRGGGALPSSPERQTMLRWASVDDLVQGRVRLQPLSVLPWIVQLGGR